VVITPESPNEFPWISIWRLVKPHANYCVDILKARWLRPAFTESYRLLRVTLPKEPVARHGVIVIVNRNRLQSITVFWVIVIDWTDQKWNVIVIDDIVNLIVIDDYFRDYIWKPSPNITVRWITVVVAEFPPLSPLIMVMFQGRLFAHLCELNPDSPTASTAFVANSRFVPASLHVGRQK